MFEQRKQAVLARIEELKQRAASQFGVSFPTLEVRFDLKGRAAGIAGHRYGKLFMRFNRDMMLNASWDHLLNDTVPHELAHIVCFINPRLGRNHDWGWKRVCVALGGGGDRCHNEAVQYAHGTVYYTTTMGYTVAVSVNLHGKIQRGKSYIWRNKGKVDKSCKFSTKAPAANYA